MTDADSKRIRRISELATIMVVFLHSGACSFSWCTDLMTQWAVPWFLVVSGYFFHGTIEKHGEGKAIFRKMSTLVVPYFAWALFGAIVLAPVIAHWHQVNFVSLLGVLHHPAYNQPLWFVRQILISMTVLVLARVILRFLRLPRQSIEFASILVYVIFFVIVRRIIFFVEMPASPYYFLIGYCLWLLPESMVNTFRLKGDKHFFLAFGLLIVACVFRASWSSISTSIQLDSQGVMMRNITNLMMIACVWIVSYSCENWVRPVFRVVFSVAPFFVYCCHYPVIRVLIPLWTKHFGQTDLARIFMMFVLTIATLGLTAILGAALRRMTPRFYSLLCGGRD